MNLKIVLAAAAFANLASGAQAAVRYEFTSTSAYSNTFGSFVLTTANFITTNQTVQANQLDSCTIVAPPGGTCGAVTIYADSSNLTNPPNNDIYDALSFGAAGVGNPLYYFADDAFSTFGLHVSILLGPDQMATLRISDTAAGTVPEPATWGMMLLGFGLVGAAARRRSGVAQAA